MAIKYKLKLKDLKLKYLIEYFKPLLKFFKPKEKIKDYRDLKNFIQKKSAWISQVTLYGYLKTRMGAKYVLMFEDEIFLGSINKAKWNIYAVALQDFCLYSISYLKDILQKQDTEKAKEIFLEILSDEEKNQMPADVLQKAKKEFDERLNNINWENHHKDLPFNNSALSLYEWSPIADELKILDRKVVLNSMILKWDIIKKEFSQSINF
ncbi:esterase [Candidatus Pelagibacter sp.]|nr:esterase [Candidatus Pelagibacter sp.]|tara:strand:+ start:116 stop:742 length:627 start_codon:yes stop_codon:yes gene_type:complete